MAQQPTIEQVEALRQFARYNGRTWKSELNLAWMTGNYPAITKDVASLQQVRNQFGPSAPDSEAFGPFKTQQEALADAQENAEEFDSEDEEESEE